MAAITNNQSNNVNTGNVTEVLSNCLLKSHETYLNLVDEGFSSDLYREVGRTVRCLAKALVEAGMLYDDASEGIDDVDTIDLADPEEEEQDA
jgi:hypothetical protein